MRFQFKTFPHHSHLKGISLMDLIITCQMTGNSKIKSCITAVNMYPAPARILATRVSLSFLSISRRSTSASMDRFYVVFQIFLPNFFVVTLITGVSKTHMYRFYVYFQAFLPNCFLFTLIK